MKNLSAHGVKLVLPSLLVALEEDSWRTKTGALNRQSNTHETADKQHCIFVCVHLNSNRCGKMNHVHCGP